VKGIVLQSIHAAAHELWGKAVMDDIGGRVSPELRDLAFRPDAVIPTLSWIPERHVPDLYRAAWEGPCGKNELLLRGLVDKAMDLGFGRVRRALLNFVGPVGLMERASELWRHNHTHGALEVARTGPLRGHVILRDHPYNDSPIMRIVMAESFRYAVALSRAKTARETNQRIADGSLQVDIQWTE
jgi:hypothetical protein